MDTTKTPRVLGPEDGDMLGDPNTGMDRFMIAGDEVENRFTMVEHRLAPYALAAPLHLHTREDEFSFILEGEVGVHIDGNDLIVRQGDLVSKPRNQWHTFWNAGDSPARILEIISPGGLEKLFRLLDTSPELLEPEAMAPLAEEYGAKLDFERTMPIVERYGLNF